MKFWEDFKGVKILTKWSTRRAVLVEQIRTLGGSCRTAASSFVDADHQLAAALNGTDKGQG